MGLLAGGTGVVCDYDRSLLLLYRVAGCAVVALLEPVRAAG